MSGGFSLGPEFCNGQSVGVSLGTAYGTQLTSGAANTKGSWTQLVASSPCDVAWAVLEIYGGANSWNDFALDIGIGAAGSEQVVWNNLYFSDQLGGGSAGGGGVSHFSLPCRIPEGSRIVARVQSVAAAETCEVTLQLFDEGFSGAEFCGVEAIGFNSASTVGTTITQAATINTKGPYVQLAASTPRDYAGVSISGGKLQAGAGLWLLDCDIAIGAAGSEQVIIPDVVMEMVSYGMRCPATIFWTPVPAGSRVAMRQANNSGTTSSSQANLTLNGIFR